MNLEKAFVALCAARAIGLTGIATAWAQSKIGPAGAGSLAEKPELTDTIILVAIAETMVILSFGVATMILFTVK